MSRSLGNIIADSLERTLAYGENLLKDVKPEIFSQFAKPGGVTVESNHGAFIYGHLSLYAPRVVAQLGGDASAIQPTAEFQKLFSHEATCIDDLTGEIYPAMDEITTAFFNSYKLALTTLRAASDEAFQKPNPMEGRMLELFPTLGSMHAFYVGGHAMLHMGQMSAWRRMQGLGSA